MHGIEWVIAVPHNIIGPRQKYDDPYRNVASILINLMLQGRQPIHLRRRQPEALLHLSSRTTSRRSSRWRSTRCVSGEIINIGPDDEFVTINELAALHRASCSSSS